MCVRHSYRRLGPWYGGIGGCFAFGRSRAKFGMGVTRFGGETNGQVAGGGGERLCGQKEGAKKWVFSSRVAVVGSGCIVSLLKSHFLRVANNLSFSLPFYFSYRELCRCSSTADNDLLAAYGASPCPSYGLGTVNTAQDTLNLKVSDQPLFFGSLTFRRSVLLTEPWEAILRSPKPMFSSYSLKFWSRFQKILKSSWSFFTTKMCVWELEIGGCKSSKLNFTKVFRDRECIRVNITPPPLLA